MIKQGLRETPEDLRDLETGALLRLPKLSELPDRFSLDTLGVKDQKDTDFCTAFATCTVSEMQEGVELSPEYSFALSKALSGDPDEWGQDIRVALKAHTKVGAIKKKDAPFSLENEPDSFLRRIANWPGYLKEKAGEHRKKAFLKITGPYDHYDNIRATIWHFWMKFGEKRGIVSGIKWQWGIDEFLLKGTSNDGFGHCIPYIGWELLRNEEGLVVQNSAGKSAGILGRHLASRDTVNHFVSRYGAYMMIDLSPEEVQWYLENKLKLTDNWLFRLWKILWR